MNDTISDDRPVRYVEQDENGNDVIVYRASGLMSCDRVYVAHARGYTPAPLPEKIRQVFNEGHHWEGRILELTADAMRATPLPSAQREVTLDLGTVRGSRVIVRGHIDGLMETEDGIYLVDAKKIREGAWPAFLHQGIEVHANYPWQMSVYWHGLQAGGVDLAGWWLAGGRLDGSDPEVLGSGNIDTVHVHQGLDAPLSFRSIRRRVSSIEKLIADGYDAPEVPCSRDQYPCPFYKLHDMDVASPVNDVDAKLDERATEEFLWPDDDAENVASILKVFKERSAKVRALEAELKDAKAEKRAASDAIYTLIEHYGADEAKRLVGHGYVVSRTRSEVKEHVVKASTRDYVAIKPIKQDKNKENQ